MLLVEKAKGGFSWHQPTSRLCAPLGSSCVCVCAYTHIYKYTHIHTLQSHFQQSYIILSDFTFTFLFVLENPRTKWYWTNGTFLKKKKEIS